MPQSFRAIVVSKKNDKFDIDIKDRTIDELPDGDLLVRVEFSSLNYKDALSATGVKGVTKVYPHTPGIDAAGIVEQSNDENFSIGSSVIVTGFDLGMDTSGGFSEYIRVPSQWAVKCSSDFSFLLNDVFKFSISTKLFKAPLKLLIPSFNFIL